MKNYLTEFIGTFFLVLTIGLTTQHDTALAPIAIGSVLMVMVYLGGHISGAHYNPAVTLAVFLRGKLPSVNVLPYMLTQILGACIASATVYYLGHTTFVPEPANGVGVIQALLAEFLFTFALALVVLNTTTAQSTEGNSFYGLAIGFTVMVGAFSIGPISGGVMNPAVGLGPTILGVIVGDSTFKFVWIYIVGPLAGGVLSAAVFKFQNNGDTS